MAPGKYFLPGLAPFGRQATVVPLTFIIGCSAVREIYEDLRRRVRDRKVNYQMCFAHTDNGWRAVRWCELHVGQLIRAVNGEQLAADCLILATSEPGSVAYVETANLDGESSLKEFWNSNTEIVYDAPNRNIYEFQGYLTGDSALLSSQQDSVSLSHDFINASTLNSQERPNYLTLGFAAKDSTPHNGVVTPAMVALSNAHIILRGARLKNTDNIYGIVLYTGSDTKLIKNSIKRVMKSSLLASITNSVMLTQFGIVLLLCVAHSILGRLAQPVPFLVSQFTNHFDDSLMSIFLQCLVLFSGFIPISLYVTLEMIQIVQGTFIQKVKYVMSDKTGTLTQNCMRFRMCSVGGVKYANRRSRREKDFSPKKLINHMTTNEMKNATQIREFLIACAICHTATTDKNSSGNQRPFFHATSPDEHALLELAADAGFVFKKRPPGKCIVNVVGGFVPIVLEVSPAPEICFDDLKLGTTLEYDLVAVLEFDSIRKRMSVIVKDPNGNYKLYIKGADQKIFERLGYASAKEMKRTGGHLQQFAFSG
ncbi:unnamed protein product [Strongylus vulgaris]|uniref:P-type ATPase N-terminal domain-containing protein n=1 Tax=Strongylus vulgaris TaxID=40348 RepID=A0A3P7HWM0_STRVU|nr:unnamed protein product [Strongylus vulgaris]